jgi:hypothetical protein
MASMPRYFFNLHYGDPRLDTQGEELPDDEAAEPIDAGSRFQN